MRLLVLVLLCTLCVYGQDSYVARVKARWAAFDARVDGMVRNPATIASECASLSTELEARRNVLVTRFNECSDDSCLYWTHHSIVRNRHERRLLKRLGKCALEFDARSQRRCIGKAVRRYRRLSRPGARGRLARFRNRWLQARRHLKELSRLILKLGKSPAVAIGLQTELVRLGKYADTLRLKRGACNGNVVCVAGVDKELKRLDTELHYVRQLGRCVDKKNIRRCVNRVLRRMKSRSVPRAVLAWMRLSKEERRQRRRERKQLLRLHRDAKRCHEADAACTRRFHKRILRLVRKIRARRNAARRQVRRNRRSKARRRRRLIRRARRRLRRARRTTTTTATTTTTTVAGATTAPTTAPATSINKEDYRAKRAVLRTRLTACKDDACRKVVHVELRALLRLRIRTLKARLSRCHSRRCRRRIQRRLRRLHKRARRYMRSRIARLRLRLAACTDEACRKRRRRAIRKSARRLRRSLKRRLRYLRRRFRRCKSVHCRDQIKAKMLVIAKTLKEMFARLERRLRSRVTRLRAALAACKDDACKTSIKGKLRSVFATIRRQLRRRLSYLRRRLARCVSDSCRLRIHAKLKKLESHIPSKHRCGRASRMLLKARARLCKSRRCRRRLRRQLRRCGSSLPRRRSRSSISRHYRMCSRRRHQRLVSKLGRCKSSRCRRRVRRSLRRCLGRRRARRHIVVLPSGPIVGLDPTSDFAKRATEIEARARQCTTVDCFAEESLALRKLYRVHLAELRIKLEETVDAANKTTLEAVISDLKSRIELLNIMLSSDLVIPTTTTTTATTTVATVTPTLIPQRTVRSCIDGLRSKTYNSRRKALRNRLSKCMSSQCRRRVSDDMLSLYRRRVLFLRRRLGACTHHWHRNFLNKRIHIVERSIRHIHNVRRRARLTKLRKHLLDCGSDANCIKTTERRIMKLTTKLDVIMREYLRLKTMLSRCGAGLAGRACRKHVLTRYRRHLHAREAALLKEQRVIARAHMARTLLACERNQAGNPAALQTCVANARAEFSNRVLTLRMRQLRSDRRRAIRQCDETADPAACAKTVETNFARDMAIAQTDAAASAAALLNRLVPTAAPTP